MVIILWNWIYNWSLDGDLWVKFRSYWRRYNTNNIMMDQFCSTWNWRVKEKRKYLFKYNDSTTTTRNRTPTSRFQSLPVDTKYKSRMIMTSKWHGRLSAPRAATWRKSLINAVTSNLKWWNSDSEVRGLVTRRDPPNKNLMNNCIFVCPASLTPSSRRYNWCMNI